MATLRTIPRVEDPGPALAAGSLGGKVHRYRKFFGGLLLAFAVSATVAVGGWGVISSFTIGPPPARVGELVETPGGFLSLQKVTPEHMAPMQMQNFANQGMNMSMPKNMDMVPDGRRRFTLDITLVAQNGVISYTAKDFRVSGEGFEGVAPIRTQLGKGTVAEGGAVSGGVIFEVPEKAENLTLSFDGGRGVALDLRPSEANGHSPNGESREGGHDD